FPRLELEGAVWATVISRFCSFLVAVSLLYFKFHLIHFVRPRWETFRISCRELLTTAVPAIANNILMPLGNMLVIGMIAAYGTVAVAGVNAANQIIMFSFMLPMAMGSVLMPFAGQNYAASRLERVSAGWSFSALFSHVYAILSLIALFFCGRQLAMFFSKDPAVYEVTVRYLYIIIFFSGFCHVGVHTGFVFNAIGKPLYASVLYVLRIIVFMLPLAWLGTTFYGLDGIFVGLSLANLFNGIIAWIWFRRLMKNACSQIGNAA
ncbi:MAG: MATE family efflux transporter, partial [Victivallales bacterium]|nr:MATE family efflux transporter [Victivallales bacterium]